MGHFFSKVSLFIDKKEAAAHLILDQDFATAPFTLQSILLDYFFFKYFNESKTTATRMMTPMKIFEISVSLGT